MSNVAKSKNEIPVQSYTSQLDVESSEELSTQYGDKEVVYKDGLPNCVDECLENECRDNQHTNDSKVNASTPIGKINNDRFARHLNHLHEDNESNFDLYSTCFIDGVENESACSPDFSSHAESLHEEKMGNDFKVYTNTLYDEDCDDEQPIFCPNVQRGSLYGIINPLFEEDMEVLDLVGLNANGDILSYCFNESEYCSSICDIEFSNNITIF